MIPFKRHSRNVRIAINNVLTEIRIITVFLKEKVNSAILPRNISSGAKKRIESIVKVFTQRKENNLVFFIGIADFINIISLNARIFLNTI